MQSPARSGGCEQSGTAASAGLDDLRPLLVADDSAGLVRAVASGRRRNHSVEFRKIELRYVDVTAGRMLQITSYDDTQAHTRNVPAGAAAATEIDRLLQLPYSHWHVETAGETVQLRVTKKGRVLVHRASRDEHLGIERGHDRKKRRRLDETDPIFESLGIATSDGQVKPSRMAKFRQVQDLLAALEPVVDQSIALGPGDALSSERPLRVADLGCGNAYLTFGAFGYLRSVREIPVHVVGIDVKAQSRAHNSRLALDLGFADQLEFVESSIEGAQLDHAPDLVLALHACDTATDDALARAITWQAPVIVAAPCCHHDIQRQLSAQSAPAPYELVTRYGILRERLADVLTDALRAAILRLAGYRVEVFEFVDTQHTPRNALIRAVRTTATASDELRAAYEQMTSDWGVEPALASRLRAHYPQLIPRGPGHSGGSGDSGVSSGSGGSGGQQAG
jgi:SAM-dependent methyltransferase